MVEVISKKNEAIEFKTLPVESIKNLKTVSWILVISNLVVLFLLIALSARFADASMRYSFLTLMYITSLICAMFALKDDSSIMLYPILVMTLSFIVIPLSAWFIVVFDKFYCTHLNMTRPLLAYYECHEYWNVPLLWSVSLLLISFQKLFEFIIFRRLMKMFELQRCNAHFCANDVSKAFSTQNDTDDEVNL